MMARPPAARFAGWLFLVAVALLATDPLSSQGRRQGGGPRTVVLDGREVVDGEVLVRYRAGGAAFERERAEVQADADEVEMVGRRGLRRMHSRRHSTRELIELLRANPDVELVEPNYIIRVDALPNDPSMNSLWGLRNFGQSILGTFGVAGADIDAALAWDLTTGNRNTVVGVVDTGVDYNHADLAANIWSSPSSFTVTIRGVNVTCPAGTHGINAITGAANPCNPMDDHNHGTHVSGTIGAVGNDGYGVAGVNWQASIMGLKFLGASGSGSIADAITAVDMAVQLKTIYGVNVRVLNNSWGGGGFSSMLLNEINMANAADILFVASAGNSASNNDVFPQYPANYNAPNVVSVAATDNRDMLASFSSYGRNTVHLGAPGVSVLSTTRNNGYAYFNGTSMAAPHVSGTAALMLSKCVLTTSELKSTLLAAVDPIAALSSNTTTGGRLNADRAVRTCRPMPVLKVNGGSSPITVGQGASVTMDMTQGWGQPGDWFSLARTTDPNPTFNQWTYVGINVTARSWTVTMPTELGTYEFRVFSNNTFTRLANSPTVTVAQLNPVPTATSINPSDAVAGTGSFSMTVMGTGFVATSMVNVDGVARATSFNSATSLTATILAGDVAAIGTRTITVTSPTPGGGTSNGLTLSVTAPPLAPTLTSLSTTSVPVGAAARTVTATGTNFTSRSVAQLNGVARPTTFVSATSLLVSLSAGDFATAAVHAIRVVTPAPGGGTSNSAQLTVVGPVLTLGATMVGPGTPIAVTLTDGPGAAGDWLSLARAGDMNQTFVSWTYVGGASSYTWTPPAPMALGTYEFRLFSNNTFTRLATSPALTVVNLNPVPVATSIQPPGLAAGSATFTLSVTGTGFTPQSVVNVDGAARTTMFVSSMMLTATIPSTDVAGVGTHAITVTTPGPGGGTSSGITLTVTAPPPAPVLTQINPTSVAVGASGATLTVTGSNFVGNSVVYVDGMARMTTFGSATTLTAMLTAMDAAMAGTRSITVVTPAPGGGTSGAALLQVIGPAISVSATSTAPGSMVTATLANGPAAPGDWLSLARVGDPNPSFVTWTYVGGGPSKSWPVMMPTMLGTYEFRLFSNNTFTRLATSPTVTVANINPAPALTVMQPANVAAGTVSFVLRITGTGFMPTSMVYLDGVARPTTYYSSMMINADIPATDAASIGTHAITVVTPSPGGGTSNALTLGVTAPPAAPTIGSINPTSVASGSTPMLTVTGTNFTGTSMIFVGGMARATNFVSSTTLTTMLMGSDTAMAGAVSVRVVTPAPGGGTSNMATLTVTGPSLTPNMTMVNPGQLVTVTLANGPAGPGDWLSLATVGDADPTFYAWTYVGGGSSTTWMINMPATPGNYEFRLFSNNTFMRLATSTAVTVVGAQ